MSQSNEFLNEFGGEPSLSDPFYQLHSSPHHVTIKVDDSTGKKYSEWDSATTDEDDNSDGQPLNDSSKENKFKRCWIKRTNGNILSLIFLCFS